MGIQRSKGFQTEEGQEQAVAVLSEAGVEGLVVIGGEGSLTGAMKLGERGVKVEALAAGESGVMVALSGELVVTLPLDEVVGRMRPLDPHMYRMAGVLSALPE